jgi:hypothetical protein
MKLSESFAENSLSCDFMRPRYASDSYASDKACRLRRIKGRACLELTQDFEAGEISLRQYDLRSRLGVRQQKRLIATEKARSAAALIAATTINQLLDSLSTGTPIQLREVVAAISDAVQT